MKLWMNTQRRWPYRIFTLLTVTVLVHLAVIWVAPRLIMHVLMTRAAELQVNGQPHFQPPITASTRAIVLPSPDLLYSTCVFDVSSGPVRVTADPQLKSYWSIALYAANSDNFYVVNDHQAAGKPVDLWLVPEGGESAQPAPAGSTVVTTPGTRGFLLMRVLTGNYEVEKNVVEPARRTLACTKI